MGKFTRCKHTNVKIKKNLWSRNNMLLACLLCNVQHVFNIVAYYCNLSAVFTIY